MIGFLGFLGALAGSSLLAFRDNLHDLSHPIGETNGYKVYYDRKGRKYINGEPVSTELSGNGRFRKVVGCRTGKVYKDEEYEYLLKGFEEAEKDKKRAEEKEYPFYQWFKYTQWKSTRDECYVYETATDKQIGGFVKFSFWNAKKQQREEIYRMFYNEDYKDEENFGIPITASRYELLQFYKAKDVYNEVARRFAEKNIPKD